MTITSMSHEFYELRDQGVGPFEAVETMAARRNLSPRGVAKRVDLAQPFIDEHWPEDSLKHTRLTQGLLREGRRSTAVKNHNAHVAEQLDRAKAGEVICLSDLMAAAEEIHAGDR
jgi:hypothetical protein